MIRKKIAYLLLATASLTASLATAGAAQAQTLDELVAKNLQAIGGKEKVEAVKGVRMTGKMTLPQGMEAAVVMERQDPNKMRMDMSIQGMTMVQAYDGKTGWKIVPFTGKNDPEPMSAEELKQMEKQAINSSDFLSTYKEQGYTAELAGKEDVEGTPTYKIKLTSKDGDVLNFFLDAEQYLLVKITGKTMMQGQEIETSTTVGDYKEVGGVLFPFSIQSKIRDFPTPVGMTFEKIEINPDIPASRFVMPPKAEKPAEKPAGTPPQV